MAGAVQGSLAQTALITVHSASVNSTHFFDMSRSIIYICRDVKRILYSCRVYAHDGLFEEEMNCLYRHEAWIRTLTSGPCKA